MTDVDTFAPYFPTSRNVLRDELLNWSAYHGKPNGFDDGDDFVNAYHLDTWVGQLIEGAHLTDRLEAQGLDFTPIPDYNPLRDEDLIGYDPLDFLRSRSPDETEWIKQKIAINRARRHQLENSADFLPRLLANVVDPINLIPVPFVKAVTVLRGMRQAAIASTLSFAPFELHRAHSLDPTAPMEEPLMAIGGTAVFAGLIGGAIGGFSGRQLSKTSNKYWMDHVVAEAGTEINAVHPGMTDTVRPRSFGEVPETKQTRGEAVEELKTFIMRGNDETEEAYLLRLREIADDPNLRARYEAVADSFAIDQMDALLGTGLSIEKTRWKEHPWLFLKNTKFTGRLGNDIRRMADEIAGSPGMFTQGSEQMLPAAHSAYIRAMGHNPKLADARDIIYDAFVRSEGSDPSGMLGSAFSAILDSAVRHLPGMRGAERMAQFKEDAWRYHANPENPQLRYAEGKADNYIEQVAEAARGFKIYMEYMGREGTANGIFGERQFKHQLRELGKKTDLRMEELEAAITKAKEAERLGDEQTALHWWGVAHSQNKALDTLKMITDDVTEQMENLLAANVRGEIPRVKDMDAMGHMPHMWIRSVVDARRKDLAKILEDHFIKSGDITSRVDDVIGHLLGQGKFAEIRTDLIIGLRRAGWHQSSIDNIIDQYDTVLKTTRGLDERVRAVSPILKKLIYDDHVRLNIFGDNNDIVWRMQAMINQISEMAKKDSTSNFGVSTSALARSVDIPTHLIHEFIETDIETVMRVYHRRMAASIEMGRAFDGDPSMTVHLETMKERIAQQIADAPADQRAALIKEGDDVIKSIEDLRDKVLGVYRMPEDPSALNYRATQFTKNWMVLALMGKPVIAAFADAGKVAMALGWKKAFHGLWKSTTTGRRAFRSGGKEAKLSGVGIELATRSRFEMLYDLDPFYTATSKAEQFAQRNVDRIFFLNMLTPYTDFMKKWSGAVIQSNIIEVAEKISKGKVLTRNEKMWVSRAGLGENDMRNIYKEWVSSGSQKDDILFLANTEAWKDPNTTRRFRTALATEVENAVITPGPSTRLNFCSTNTGSIMMQFKGFAFAATHQILGAGLQMRDMKALQGIVSMIAIGMLVDRYKSPDYDPRGPVSLDRIIQAVDYSGVTGIFFDINNLIEVVSGHEAGLRPLLGIEPLWKDQNIAQQIGQIGGPAASLMGEFIWSMTSPDAEGSDRARSIRRLVPFNNMLWWNGIVNQLQREASGFLD